MSELEKGRKSGEEEGYLSYEELGEALRDDGWLIPHKDGEALEDDEHED